MFRPELVHSLKAYKASDFKADLLAGVIVGLVALPLCLAIAIASGLPPEAGIYTSVAGGFLVSALGGTKYQIGGPAAAFIVIVAGIAQRHGVQGLFLATMIAGLLLALMGLFRLGTLVKFVPYPIIVGFTAGVGVLIFSQQIRDFAGLPIDKLPPDFIEQWKIYPGALPLFNVASLGVGFATLALIRWWPKRFGVPGTAAALVLCTAAVWYFQLPVATISSRFGEVPQGMPWPKFPEISLGAVRAVFPDAVTLALLGAIESLLSAVVADSMSGDRHNSNAELLGQGAANFVSPLFGGAPVTGVIVRTAVNIKQGGKSPIAGMIHSLTLLLVLLVAAPLASRVPMACLAGILISVAWHMLDLHTLRSLARGPRADLAVMATTLSLTVLIDLRVAVEVGMIMAAFLFMKQMSDVAQIKVLTREPGDTPFEHDPSRAGLDIPADVKVFEMHGSFFFGAVRQLMDITRRFEKRPRALILEMRGVLHMDASGLRALQTVAEDCQKRGIRFIISGIHSQPFFVVQESESFGPEILKGDLKEALSCLE